MIPEDVEGQIAQLLSKAAREENHEELDKLLNEIRFLLAVEKSQNSSPRSK